MGRTVRASARRQQRQQQTASICERLEDRRLLAFTALVDFQPSNVPTQAGYLRDTGATFADRGNGAAYGWSATNNNGIDRNSKKSPNQAYDTFNHMQKGGNFSWEIAVPNGTYNVRVVSGDAVLNTSDFYQILAEGRQSVQGRPSTNQLFIGSYIAVTVTDGRLTITNGPSAINNKINFIEVTEAAPLRPSNLAATATSATTVNLSWTDNSLNEDGFVLERNHTSNLWERVATLGENVTSFTDTGRTPSTTYNYRVRAFNDVGQSFDSNVAKVTTPAVPGQTPAAPSDLTFTVSSNLAQLTWSDNSDNEEKFVVQRLNWSGTFETYRELPANTTTTYAFLNTAQINQFRVVARNSAGGNSAPSNVASIAAAPAQPLYPFAGATSSSSIEISWDSIDSCQFHVERLDNGVWVRIASDVLSLSYHDTGLQSGTSYSYRVIAAAVNEAGDSAPSDVASTTTAPAAVTGLAVTGVTSSSVALKWDDATGEGGYVVERSIDGVRWTQVAILHADVTTYTNTGLASQTTYLFRVTGFSSGIVLGDLNSPVSAKTA
jgi:hypothetical protein